MIYYVTHIKDTIGNNYLGIRIPIGIADPFLVELKDIIGSDDFDKYTKFHKNRDGGEYHITVINVSEYNKLVNEMGMDKFINSLDKIFKYPVDDLRMLGIGTAERNSNRAYFIVCESDKLSAIRSRYNLSEYDFHITLGFYSKDVFGIRKNQVLKKGGKFLKLLSQEFYNDDWNFIKKIGNYDLDPKSEIIPIDITDTHIKVKCDDKYMDIGYLEDGEKFWIMTKYPIDEELPRLSETEVSKILKNK